MMAPSWGSRRSLAILSFIEPAELITQHRRWSRSVPAIPQRRPKKSLTDRTTSGYAWMILQAGGSQVVAFAGNIILGWLLFQDDFGLYALANTIHTAALLVRQIGLRAILVHRARRFHLWSNTALWFSLTVGVVAALIAVVAAPFAEAAFEEEGISKLVFITAIGMPFSTMSIVPEAAAQAALRFRLLATLRFGILTARMLLMILLAALGFGAYSFVIPYPALEILHLAVLLWLVRPRILPRPQLRRWRYLVGQTTLLFVSNMSTYVVNQCDYVILGLFHNKLVVGIYFFAYSLSQRVMVLLVNNLRDVLFPALATLQHDPVRQARAFLRASRLLAIIGVPGCLLQIVAAEPLFDALLPQRWRPSIPVLQILSAGTIFRLVGQPSLSLLWAQARYRMLLVLGIVIMMLFIVAVTAGAAVVPAGPDPADGTEVLTPQMARAAVAVAVAVSLFMLVQGLSTTYIAIRPGGGRWRDVGAIYLIPVSAGCLAAGVSAWAARLVPEVTARAWCQLALILLTFGLVYLPLIRLLAPEDTADLMMRFRGLASRLQKKA